MTKEQNEEMNEYYQEQVDKNLLRNLDGAIGFKLGYERALNIACVSVSVWVVRDTHMGQIQGMFTTQDKAIKYCGDTNNLSITNMDVG